MPCLEDFRKNWNADHTTVVKSKPCPYCDPESVHCTYQEEGRFHHYTFPKDVLRYQDFHAVGQVVNVAEKLALEINKLDARKLEVKKLGFN